MQRVASKARSRSNGLPTVAGTPIYGVVGVSRSIHLQHDPEPPYVRREVDELLDRALQQQRFVLVVGPSKAGKSRSAIEAVRRHFPASRLVVPRDGARALAGLAGETRVGTGRDLPCSGSTTSTGISGTRAGSIASCSAGSGGRTSGW